MKQFLDVTLQPREAKKEQEVVVKPKYDWKFENSINYGKENGETNAGVYIVDSKQVFIEITDDGIGINDEHISRVFERFYRTDSARSRNAASLLCGSELCFKIYSFFKVARH